MSTWDPSDDRGRHDGWALDVPDSVWECFDRFWDRVHKVTIHVRRGTKRFTKELAVWEKTAGSVPSTAVHALYAERHAEFADVLGEELQIEFRLWNVEEQNLAKCRMGFEADPTVEGQFTLLGALKSSVGLLERMHRLLEDSYERSARNQELSLGSFNQGLTMQQAVIEYVWEKRNDVARAEAVQQTVDRGLSWLEGPGGPFVKEMVQSFARVDTGPLAHIPPDLIPLGYIVLAGDRWQLQRYLDAIKHDPATLKDIGERLRESPQGRAILEQMEKLARGS